MHIWMLVCFSNKIMKRSLFYVLDGLIKVFDYKFKNTMFPPYIELLRIIANFFQQQYLRNMLLSNCYAFEAEMISFIIAIEKAS